MIFKNSMFIFLFTLLFAMFLIISCDDDPASTDDDLGEGSVSVTGDINAEASGIADFWGIEDGPGGIHSWEIYINDYAPSTFSLQFMQVSQEPISRPQEGTYEVGLSVENPFDGNDERVFSGIYNHFEDGDYINPLEYSSFPCAGDPDFGGTLTIESSDSDMISGHFQFTAAHYEFDDSGNCEILGTIELNGNFATVERDDG
jgi:hypothetical protein